MLFLLRLGQRLAKCTESWQIQNQQISRSSVAIPLWRCYQLGLRFCYCRQCRQLFFCQEIRVFLLQKTKMTVGPNRGYSGALRIALGSVNLYFCFILITSSCRLWTEWLNTGFTGELVENHGASWYWQYIPTLHCLNKRLGFSYTFCEILSRIIQEWQCIQRHFCSFNISSISCATEAWQISSAIKTQQDLGKL